MSWRERERERVVEYISIDIYSPVEQNLILDLSQENIINKLKEKIGNWKPNFIWASPLCTTFSRATSIKGGTISYILDRPEMKVRLRTPEEYKLIEHKAYKKYNTNKKWINTQIEKGKLGLNLLNNTIKIIEYFNIPFAIENPAMALSRYLLKDFERQVASYCMYGMPYRKNTGIYTSKKINVLKCNHKGSHEQVMSGWKSKTGIKNAPSSNKDRSVVPLKLIQSILEQLLLEER